MLTEFVPTRERISEQFPLLLTTGPHTDFSNNVGTQDTAVPRIRNGIPKTFLEMSLGDMANARLRDSDSVTIISRFGSTRLKSCGVRHA